MSAVFATSEDERTVSYLRLPPCILSTACKASNNAATRSLVSNWQIPESCRKLSFPTTLPFTTYLLSLGSGSEDSNSRRRKAEMVNTVTAGYISVCVYVSLVLSFSGFKPNTELEFHGIYISADSAVGRQARVSEPRAGEQACSSAQEQRQSKPRIKKKFYSNQFDAHVVRTIHVIILIFDLIVNPVLALVFVIVPHL
ncbi:hypothetical protein K461DRAFT_10984 [Myriangium duriaei CBS 260.36]|uniref:Uncharacterized protein n=1 Tax=Myriangium duriaei CBS 260.36 TaxID=1168546 RepID=A0A9P4J958_9PEZI|nr:hypothetical protein K461DRAFT_10984 [Myriangium duriaei CBS 260.36]